MVADLLDGAATVHTELLHGETLPTLTVDVLAQVQLACQVQISQAHIRLQ